MISLLLITSLIHLLTGFSNPPLKDLPQIIEVKTSPYPIIHNWVTLPRGPGKLKIDVIAKNTKKVQFWIAPTGTGTWKYRKLIGEDTDGRDGWSIEWKYGSELLLNHIIIVAINPKGTGEIIFNVETETKAKKPRVG